MWEGAGNAQHCCSAVQFRTKLRPSMSLVTKKVGEDKSLSSLQLFHPEEQDRRLPTPAPPPPASPVRQGVLSSEKGALGVWEGEAGLGLKKSQADTYAWKEGEGGAWGVGGDGAPELETERWGRGGGREMTKET